MGDNLSIWALVGHADPVVKFILFILLICSVWSWSIIIQKYLVMKKTRQETAAFLKKFWSGTDISNLYSNINTRKTTQTGIAALFVSGFRSYLRLQKNQNVQGEALIDGVERSMRVSLAKEVDMLEYHLALLASIGSVAPYIGLLGTVWGIMGSFTALGGVEQATLALVAPHIAEALIATALGLFVAIPAVVAYNRFTRAVESMQLEYENFQDEFCSIIHRQAY